ncbi:MAG: DUF2961 domain-containing protein [Verrucomicrobia bacterium]|nr:DUF2961 domain-containing protein [Verrucomicrobiota bacterium]
MTNINAIAERPLGNSFLESSYDRTGGNADWSVWRKADANGRITLLDTDGPGYVSRAWIASFSAKRWLFFFDGEEKPRLSLTQKELFGERFPFVPPLAGKSGGGKYSLVPIPFEKHLRIEVNPKQLNPNDRNYFQINYTLLDADAECQSWPAALSAESSNAVVATCEALQADETDLSGVARACLQDAESTMLPPGASVSVLDAREAGVVTGMAIRLDSPVPSLVLRDELLRKLRLKMWWDGKKVPSVDVPLGDFFCNPFYTRSFASRFLGRVGGAFVCRIPMPYRQGARIEVVNDSSVSVGLTAHALVGEAVGSLQRLFHANWRASTRSGSPLAMTESRGPGHYVGCFLTAIGQDGSWNILEGDERLLPDPGVQPVQHGTGLEDYFSGAYYYTSLFDLSFHGLIEKGAMRTDQYRLHLLDAVDFEDAFSMDIEFGDGNRARGYMSSVAYWYADSPQDCTLPKAQMGLLDRPADRFELPGFMAMLFTLEREGLWEDAAIRCDYMATRHAAQPWVDLLRLRAVACRERTEGFESVRDEYEQLTKSSFPAAARQAQDLLWAHEVDTHALLGLHMRGKYTVWIDGIKIATGSSQARLDVRRLDLKPGRHSWEVDFEPTTQGSIISMCLRTKWGDIISDGDWEIVDMDPLPGRKPPESFAGASPLPNMTVWQFEPNGFPAMQSGAQTIPVWSFWDSRPKAKRVRLRQFWTNGPSVATRAADPRYLPERSAEEQRAHAID